MKLDQIEEEPVKKMEPCGAIDTNGRKSIEKKRHMTRSPFAHFS